MLLWEEYRYTMSIPHGRVEGYLGYCARFESRTSQDRSKEGRLRLFPEFAMVDEILLAPPNAPSDADENGSGWRGSRSDEANQRRERAGAQTGFWLSGKSDNDQGRDIGIAGG